MNQTKQLDTPVDQTTVNMPVVPKEAGHGKLLACFLGIFVSYFIYGVLQEKITKSQYGTDSEQFTFTLALVFFQCIVNAIFAQLGLLYSTPGRDTAPHSMYAAMSFSYLGAMLASNHALQFITYPTQVLGKSVKPIPIMIMGVLYAKKKYPAQKYFFVILITIGVALFTYKDKSTSGLDADHTFGWGEILLIVSLCLDGMTGGIQDKIRSQYQTEAWHMMLNLNTWSILYLAIALVVTGEGMGFVHFAAKFPYVLFNMLSFSVLSAIGQAFIFLTVTSFGPLMCSIITTTRKFFTILGSVIIFSHAMTSRQWLGTVFVFIGLSLDIRFGKEAKKHDKKPDDSKNHPS